MQRRIGLIVAIGLMATACGGAASPTAVDTQPPTTATPAAGATDAPTAPDTTADATASTATPSSTAAGPDTSGLPEAPAFTLDLADGTTFVLADEQKPVYLVFWAEW